MITNRTLNWITLVMLFIAIALSLYAIITIGSEGGVCTNDPLGYYINKEEVFCWCNNTLLKPHP